MNDPTQIIIHPLLTEKSTHLQALRVLADDPAAPGRKRIKDIRKYTFRVAMRATKVDVRLAIEALGGCRVEKVNTMVVKGKTRRTRRGTGRTSDWKKAIVTLREGETLSGVLGDAFEGV